MQKKKKIEVKQWYKQSKSQKNQIFFMVSKI